MNRFFSPLAMAAFAVITSTAGTSIASTKQANLAPTGLVAEIEARGLGMDDSVKVAHLIANRNRIQMDPMGGSETTTQADNRRFCSLEQNSREAEELRFKIEASNHGLFVYETEYRSVHSSTVGAYFALTMEGRTPSCSGYPPRDEMRFVLMLVRKYRLRPLDFGLSKSEADEHLSAMRLAIDR